MSWLNIQNVSLGSGPVEGQMWDSVTKGEGGLIIGQTHYIDRHLQKKKWKQMRLSTENTDQLFPLPPSFNCCAHNSIPTIRIIA